MALRLVDAPEPATTPAPGPGDGARDPQVYRAGLSSARAALRAGVARRHERRAAADPDEHPIATDAPSPASEGPR